MKRITVEQRTAYLDKKKKPEKFKKKGNFNKEEIQSLVAQAVSKALEKPCKQPRASDEASVKLQTQVERFNNFQLGCNKDTSSSDLESNSSKEKDQDESSTSSNE